MTIACPFPLPSKGLLVVMSETEDVLLSTDWGFISPELLNRPAQPLASKLKWLGHTSMFCGSLHYLLWIKTRKLLSLQTPTDTAQTSQRKEGWGRKSSLGLYEWSVCAHMFLDTQEAFLHSVNLGDYHVRIISHGIWNIVQDKISFLFSLMELMAREQAQTDRQKTTR